MRRRESSELVFCLFLKYFYARSSCHKSEEGRGWVQRPCAELRMCLEANEIGMTYEREASVLQTRQCRSLD
jgi:hypothetical protein